MMSFLNKRVTQKFARYVCFVGFRKIISVYIILLENIPPKLEVAPGYKLLVTVNTVCNAGTKGLSKQEHLLSLLTLSTLLKLGLG